MPNFSVFDKLESKLRNVTSDVNLEGIIERAADRQEDLMIELNIKQLKAGKLATGESIRPEYKPFTKEMKRAKGQPTNRVTLKDTGDFHNSIRVKQYPGRYELISQDKKSEMLQDKYSPSILGLSDFNLSRIKARMKPLMRRDLRNLLKSTR